MESPLPDKVYGLYPVPADFSKLPRVFIAVIPIDVSDINPPDTPLVKRINEYAKQHLSPQTYNHSLRVYTFGRAIARTSLKQIPLDTDTALDETWFLTAILHDIGTCDEFISSTKLSFEFWGGYHALDILQNSNGEDDIAPRIQAESVAEAIIRHQDIQTKGNITVITLLIHLSTLLDNIGSGKELLHMDTIRAINEKHDRKGWCGCFKATVEKEKGLKPWTMVSRIEGFEEKIQENGSKGLMAEWE